MKLPKIEDLTIENLPKEVLVKLINENCFWIKIDLEIVARTVWDYYSKKTLDDMFAATEYENKETGGIDQKKFWESHLRWQKASDSHDRVNKWWKNIKAQIEASQVVEDKA